MNTYNIFNVKKGAAVLLGLLFIASLSIISCNKTEEQPDPYFQIEGSPTGLSVDMNENSQSYVVRSNRPWEIVAQEEGDWVRAFPDKGEDDGIFKFLINENDVFVNRTMNFAFIVDGEEQPVLFRIDQEANVPYILIMNGDTIMSIPSVGGVSDIIIKANVDWTYSLDDDSWLTEVEVAPDVIKFQAAKNLGDERSAILTVSANEFAGLEEQIILKQSSYSIVLEENFNWLHYGNATPYLYDPSEVRYDDWTPEEKAMGWDVTPNIYSGSQKCVYARPGFLKLGKTTYGGDIISSPLSTIEGTVNLRVTFKAAVYCSAGGTIDDRVLKVFALNAGTPSVDVFEINNVPNNKAQDDSLIVNDIWDPARAYSFTITGATSATQLKFLAGDYNLSGVGKGKNRILIDDIKAEIIQ